MTDQKTKNIVILDHDDDYIPILKTPADEIQISASFSLAEQRVRSGKHLKRLIDFIRNHMQSSIHCGHNDDTVGVSHRLAAQVVYLAYWENYPLEFRMEGGTNIVIRALFSRRPELTFTLGLFRNGVDPHSEIQGWWNFFSETISDHAEIWHIPLVVDESVYGKLTPGNYPRVQVDVIPNLPEKRIQINHATEY